jgi:hypothetical protein
VQVGVQIGLDDIEKITREKNKLSKGKARARHPWWWVFRVGFGLGCQLAELGGCKGNRIAQPGSCPQEAV